MEGIKTGWVITRDMANLFFIFIILYIAIAIILQLSGYGMKDLLVKVIIIALLVNFSGLITKVIIDGSNIFALEFYNKIQVKSSDGKDVGIAGVFADGLKLTTVYKEYKGTENPSVPKPAGQFTIWGVILGTFGGTLVILVSAFVFFAFGIMFIGRTVVLLFLFILSPLAFLAMALPKTEHYANEWWEKLFKQAIFAPACLFMVYLVAKIISTNSLLKATGAEAAEGLLESLYSGADVNIIVYFAILIGLMVGSLIIAQKLGAHGASTMMKWGKDARKGGQGYAGKISRRGAGYTAEKAIDENSWINRKTGGRIAKVAGMPLVGRGFAKVSSLRQQEIEKKEKQYKKDYGSYSNVGLETILRQPLITREKRKAIGEIQKERKEKGAKQKRKDELRKVADDPNQNTTTRLAAMKMLGELDVQTELEETKKQLESEKAKSAEKATFTPAEQAAPKLKETTEKT